MAKEKEIPIEDTAAGNESPPQFKTVVKVTQQEEDELIESLSKPIQELDNALEQQRQEEQNTMKMLIAENVKMEKEVKKADERVQEMHTKVELMKLDVEAEKAKTREKEVRMKEMENEMTMLILAKKSEKKKDKKKGKKAEEIENQAEGITSKYTEKEPELPYNEKYDKKIKDLNFRLRRMAGDDEAKDKRIVNLEEQLEATQEYAIELEKDVDSNKVEEIKKRLEERKKNKNVHYYDKANIVSRNGNAKESAVCAIQ